MEMTRARMMATLLLVSGAAGMAALQATGGKPNDTERREKIGLRLRVSPPIGFSPMRVVVSAELRGDLPPATEPVLYCAATEWDWGDGTRSESSYDCEPFEAGRSVVKRRFAAEHTYHYSGRFQVQLRLKRNNRVLLASNSSVQVRPGAREWSNIGD